MDVRTVIQEILDNTLLPYGVLSNHLRRVETDYIENSDVKVNQNEYVVFRVISNRPHAYGDGVQMLSRVYIDVNYYYSYEKTDPRYTDVLARLQAVKRAILSDKHFRLANNASDIADIDNPFRGENIEFVYFGVADNE